MSKKIQLAVGGKTYPSMKAMCRELGVDYCLFMMRKRAGRPIEECIRNGRLKRKDTGSRVGFAITRAKEIDVGGVHYSSIKEYAKSVGMSYMEVWRKWRKEK